MDPPSHVELATPIVVGDERVTYDRGQDYFAYARLMESCDTVVAGECQINGVIGLA